MDDNNSTDQIVNVLPYLSILFLSVISPLIVQVITKNSDRLAIARNARHAFRSQTFPLLYVIGVILVFSVFSLSLANFYGGALLGTLLAFVLSLAPLLFIYNIAMAAKMLIGRG